MDATSINLDAAQRRAEALEEARRGCADAVRDSQVEYSEMVGKLRERFEIDLADALEHYRHGVINKQRAYNAAVIQAEREYASAVG